MTIDIPTLDTPATKSDSDGEASTIRLPTPQLSCFALEKSYRKADHEVPVLRGVDLEVREGEFLSIIGQSGSGKSTLLHLMGLLDGPDVGEIRLGGKRIDDLPERTLDELRNHVFGFVFQFYHLLPELSLLENVLSPLMIRLSMMGFWRKRKELREQAREMIAKVGLDHRLSHKPKELSGGEMQRAAIARALVSQPRILLADEPTGNLDGETGREIMDLLCELNDRDKLTIVMVTHDAALAKEADRSLKLEKGRLAGQSAAA